MVTMKKRKAAGKLRALGVETIIIGLIGQLPSLINAINALIARGKASGELTPAAADALTAKASAIFAAYSQPAPPPPGV